MDAQDRWRNVAGYMRRRHEGSGLRLKAFARRMGTNDKTMAKLLAGEEVRGDALDRIVDANGWPADAFDRIMDGQDPEAQPPLVLALAERVSAIEQHLGLEDPTVTAEAISADPSLSPSARRKVLAAYRAARKVEL